MHTRTRIHTRHALIAPDGYVPSAFPGWFGMTCFVLISPAMGANFSQFLIVIDALDHHVGFAADANEHVIYVEKGDAVIHWAHGQCTLSDGGFFFAPPGLAMTAKGTVGTRMTVYRKVYQPLEGYEIPQPLWGESNKIKAEPFLGNPRAMLQTLLPIDPAFDMAVNIFTYEPGATLPFVETHIMEHGLLMLSGQGVYRLEENYYPVQQGDAIWMAPYCPQWFAAIGDVPASYLYHKDIHRLP